MELINKADLCQEIARQLAKRSGAFIAQIANEVLPGNGTVKDVGDGIFRKLEMGENQKQDTSPAWICHYTAPFWQNTAYADTPSSCELQGTYLDCMKWMLEHPNSAAYGICGGKPPAELLKKKA
jgi:hypothetical protein